MALGSFSKIVAEGLTISSLKISSVSKLLVNSFSVNSSVPTRVFSANSKRALKESDSPEKKRIYSMQFYMKIICFISILRRTFATHVFHVGSR